MSAADLWTAVKARYDTAGLVSLTNVRDRSATTIDDSVGQQAAETAIALWPIYAQEDYDATNSVHVEVGTFGVIAILWRRGGSSTSIEQIKYDEVFSESGMIALVRETGPRSRPAPVSNSGVSTKSELVNGRRVRGWSDRDSLPPHYLPNRTIAED